MKRLLGIVMVLAAVFALGACKKKNPCQDLADKVCKELGSDSEDCAKFKEMVKEAGDNDEAKKACEELGKTVDDLIKMSKEMKAMGAGTEAPAGGEAPAAPPAQ